MDDADGAALIIGWQGACGGDQPAAPDFLLCRHRTNGLMERAPTPATDQWQLAAVLRC